MERYTLTEERQREMTVDELASLIFEILRKNLLEGRKVEYDPGQLSSIRAFEFLRDYTRRQGAYQAGGWEVSEVVEFREKFAEAANKLKLENLIMDDPGQHSSDVVILTSTGKKIERFPSRKG